MIYFLKNTRIIQQWMILVVLLYSSIGLLAQGNNLIENGEFDNKLNNWDVFINQGDFSAKVVKGESMSGQNAVRTTLIDPGPDSFSVGIRQFVRTSARKNTIYNLSFQAKADADRPMVVELLLGGESTLFETVQLSQSVKEYKLTAISNADGEITVAFLMGTNTSNIVIDNVKLITGDQTPQISDRDVITNGEFNDGLNGWEELNNDGGDLTPSVATNENISGAYAFKSIINTAGTVPYSTGILQRIQSPSKIDHFYDVSFLAKAQAPRDIVVEYKINGKSKIYKTIKLTESPKRIRFTIPSNEVGTMELLFFLGVNSTTVYLDAISVVEDSDVPLSTMTANFDQAGIGGGGYVTGIYYHPTTPNLLYMRTDVGGAFRYNYEQKKWITLATNFPLGQENFYGINALALAPSNDNYVYISTGKSEFSDGQSDVLVSRNRGRSWTPTGLNKELFASSDFFNKIMGPALAVDPNNATRIYAGTANNGLWFKDGNKNWKRVNGIPNGATNLGVKSIVFAPNGDLIVGVPEVGVFRRINGENVFKKINGAPTSIYKIATNSQNHIYVATNNGIRIYANGNWRTQRSGKTITGLSIHPKNDNKIVAVESGFGSRRGEIYSTVNRGANWSTIRSGTNDYQRKRFPRWYPDFFWVNAPSSIHFNPHKSNAVTYADFFAVWHTNNIQKKPSIWRAYSRGHEETYVIDLVSPTAGPRLISGLADVLGFKWNKNLRQFPKTTLIDQPGDFVEGETVNNGTSIDYCSTSPKEKVFAANINNFGGQGFLFRTNDNFKTFTKRKVPGSMGRVAMSATTPENMVILTQGSESKVFFTKNNGVSWTPSNGAPEGLMDNMFRSRNLLTSDRVNGSVFYLYENGGRFYRSVDGGVNFSLVNNNLPTSANFDKWETKAMPAVENEVWVSLDNAGLYRSTNGGNSFQKIPGIKRSYTFGFGKGKVSGDPPVVYIYGQVNDLVGLFSSRDSGATWTYINSGIKWSNGPRSLTGDMQKYGYVYIGSNGSGILTVDIEDADKSEDSPNVKDIVDLDKSMYVYPNPAYKGYTDIKFMSEDVYSSKLLVYDFFGKLVSEMNVDMIDGENSIRIQTSTFSSGLYMAIVDTKNQKLVTRFIVN